MEGRFGNTREEWARLVRGPCRPEQSSLDRAQVVGEEMSRKEKEASLRAARGQERFGVLLSKSKGLVSQASKMVAGARLELSTALQTAFPTSFSLVLG